MTNTTLFRGMLIGVSSLFLLWQFLLPRENNIISAQSSDIERQKLLERDKNVPEERVERAFAEAKKIQEDIVAAVSSKYPKSQLQRSSARHLKYGNSPGRRGVTRSEVAWQMNKTRIWMDVTLELNNESALKLSHNGLKGISMGEFFDAPGIGDEATLVKNVVYNTRVSQVSIHFVKGRADVSVYLTNFQRKTAKNEKELMEIVRLIEPLIVAKPNFDDL